MEIKKFNLWNKIVAAVVTLIAAFTYLSTIEPSASFWDCGEFIASSYKLEVGHPPGNPVFQLIARFFTMFTGASGAAVAVNVMSALCSALTILFLYLTIVFLVKRFVKPDAEGKYTVGQAISIYGSAAVGALAYTFSDTFWFSAVEGEVYAMSSLFTAIVFWAMTKWYEQADQPYANRWIVLISFLMGLSIGVHLLNLLTIPCLVFLYYFRKREDAPYSVWEYIKIMLLSVVILALVLFVVIPWVPKLAAYMDVFAVNKLGLPVNAGAAIFMTLLLALCFFGIYKLYDKEKIFWTSALMCLTTILIGFSIFSIIIIRSSVKPPTNENQPDNAFSLVRYLSREQYGSAPLVYGQYYGSPYEDFKTPQYWALVGDKYKKVNGPIEPVYSTSGKMLFPRMWSNQQDLYIKFYQSYSDGKGVTVPGAKYKKPTFGTNMRFFFDYQLNWMYWRYFMWNFAGRQNEIHGMSPGELLYGNWESGIKPLDEMRLGDQSDAPDALKHNKGKNHYYLLPLLLGILGLFYQFDKDKRGCWLVFLLFFMTGIAIVMYLNQPPYQVRERDYAYAGSFYAFTIWIGIAVAAIGDWLSKLFKGKGATATAVATGLCLCVPALMAQQNWDDHNRSHRKTAAELAYNYLSGVGQNGILVTHGDNDTFPLWYSQEVESVRPDVRVVNTSLLGTDWYIDQMRYAINESAPLPISIPQEQYLYGTNDYVRIVDTRDQVIPIADVMRIFKHPEAKITLEDGSREDYIVSRKISIPVNKENALKYGIISEQFADEIPDEIIFEMPKDKNMLSKGELFFLDLMSGYQWDRPINLLSLGGEINVGQKDYLMYDGFSSRLVPIKNKITSSDLGKVDLADLLNKMDNVYKWDALSRKDYFVDYQNMYTFMGVISQRDQFVKMADLLIDAGDSLNAVRMLDKCQVCVPEENFPLETICLGFSQNDISVISMVQDYYLAGAPDKARDLAKRYGDKLIESIKFFLEYYDYDKDDFELGCSCLYYLNDIMTEHGDKEISQGYLDTVKDYVTTVSKRI